MVFSSLPFLFLIFPFFLAALLCGSFFKNAAFRNCSVLIISLFFYIWEESTNTLILIAICLINYYGASYLANEKHGKKIFIALIALNLLLLFIFKYSLWCLSFVTDRFIDKNIMLLGISFFIFHAISYLADVHTKKIQASKNLLDFSTYFCMFPHLVAGPIVRYAQIKDDIRAYRASKELFSFGMYRFLLGLNKKIIIANSVSILADFTFSATSPKVFSFMDAWTGIIAYGLQIYFDFSAYSDMAVGLAAMAGFRFEENFNRPYISTSVREFWRRWHISLSTWLRDYLYIPLGGSKSAHAYITYRNLFLVFLLCALAELCYLAVKRVKLLLARNNAVLVHARTARKRTARVDYLTVQRNDTEFVAVLLADNGRCVDIVNDRRKPEKITDNLRVFVSALHKFTGNALETRLVLQTRLIKTSALHRGKRIKRRAPRVRFL